jgi:hypothetical protein
MAKTIHVRGEGGVVWEMALPLPDGIAQRLAKGDLTRVNEDGSPYEQPTPQPEQEPPAKTASKAAWVDYAVDARAADRTEAEAMTKADLVDRYGG